MFSWFKRCKKTEIQSVIFIDISYACHCLSKILLATDEYAVIAYIDEEPWNHRHLMNGVKIHYPSELVALTEKYRVAGVIQFKGEGWQPDQHCRAALARLKVSYILLDPNIAVAQQVDIVAQQL